MNIINETIKHKVFGEGTVISQGDGRFTVQFSDEYGTKQFQYPEAFEHYLKVCKVALEEGIMEDLRERERQLDAEKERKRAEYEKEVVLKNLEKMKLDAEKKKAARATKAANTKTAKEANTKTTKKSKE